MHTGHVRRSVSGKLADGARQRRRALRPGTLYWRCGFAGDDQARFAWAVGRLLENQLECGAMNAMNAMNAELD